MIRTFARIAPQRPQARLLLIDEGTHRRSLLGLAQRLGLGERVMLPGAVPHSEVPHYAAAADLFVFSSVTDTQGLVLIEAMAAGTPVVAVETPGSVDVLAEGGGILVPPREEDFADAVLELLSNEPQRRARGKKAMTTAQRYSILAATQCLLSVYRTAVEIGPCIRK